MSSQDSERPVRWHVTSEIDASDFHMHGRSLFLVFAFLAVVVLTSFLVLYTRWVCRNHRHHFPSHASPQAPPSFLRQGLHPAIIKSLPITLHESAMISDPDEVKEAAECCICLGEFEDGDKVKIFPVCRHSFHSDCLDRWLAGRSTCPLCRTSLDGAVLSILTE